MSKIELRTSQRVIPMCYAYSTPEIKRHDGWVKIGYTEKQDVSERIRQQTHTADVLAVEEWRGNAIFEDGSGEYFKDTDFHAYLRKNGIEYSGEEKNEWFHVDGPTSKGMFWDFKSNRGILTKNGSLPYRLRNEQKQAVEETIQYRNNNIVKNEFLWNCKPRFGKTLTAYDLMQKLNCFNTLIVTNRPAIANSWYEDYKKFVGDQDYYFVADTDSLRGKQYVISNKDFEYKRKRIDGNIRQIRFTSLQDLKGSIYFGGSFNKLKEIKDTEWDLLIVDEAHEGVDTYKTDVAFDQIKRKFTLHLSGTPFKALANNKFDKEAIYNWTYADEQKAKREWEDEDSNPYEDMPKLNLYTYQMSKIVEEEVEQGLSINDEVEEYCFDLNEFFKVNDNGSFVHNKQVDKFIDALTTQDKFPFSTQELRDEIKHSFWLLDRVESAKALVRKLKNHPVFKDYVIIDAVGDGSYDDMAETKKSFDRVKVAIKNNDKTITLSVGQLTTGVTIPEWTAVLMLCNCKSPSLYMQAAFRAQNPCMFKKGTEFYRKENAYVFDFDPARTLIIFEQFANDLNGKTSGGTGSGEERKHNVRELLNFFPVIGEDEEGKMIELDAEKVLTIPRKIKSTEVVTKGFMSNFLFRNIANIFSAPKELRDILEKCTPTSEPKNKTTIEKPQGVTLDDEGNVVVDQNVVIGKHAEYFGEKIYGEVQEVVENVTTESKDPGVKPIDTLKEHLNNIFKEALNNGLYQDESYSSLKSSDRKQIEREASTKIEYGINVLSQSMKIEEKTLEQEYQDNISKSDETGKSIEEITEEHQKKKEELQQKFSELVQQSSADLMKEVATGAIETAEKKVQEHKLETVEDKVRDHLRGFARTIPSFLMAYGDENTTIENFDKIIPSEVFLEVTSITLAEFRMLRDGGDHQDEFGNIKHFDGLFDEVVFNDSIKEFLSKKKQLANYFDETATEDIFDYIPPQKTNQIYTPKRVVKMMVDMLEKENPGCFDNPDATFIDPYMKSGLYIAEIVKRLFRSEQMKQYYPDEEARLQHIFEKQVYGLAPTEIIYNIAKNFILGFTDDIEITKHNLVLCDSLPYAENGTLKQKLDELFD